MHFYYKQDSTIKILELMDGKPDLIIGNYTDGNLVSSLMASKLGVTQVSLWINTLIKCLYNRSAYVQDISIIKNKKVEMFLSKL